MLLRVWVILAIAVQPLVGVFLGSACACRERAPASVCACGGGDGCCGERAATPPDESSCCGATADEDDAAPMSCCAAGDHGLARVVCAAACRVMCETPGTPIAPVQRASVTRPPQPTPMATASWPSAVFARGAAFSPSADRLAKRDQMSGRAILDLHCIRLI